MREQNVHRVGVLRYGDLYTLYIFYTVNGCWILEDQGEIFNDNFICICKANVPNDCADKLLDSLSRNDAVAELCCGKVNEAYFRDQE
jgi:hypothetical protein